MSTEIIIKKKCDNKIEECQIRGGIDTLYCFLDAKSTELYQTLWSSVNSGTFSRENYHHLGFSGKKNGFIGAWYSYIGRGNIPLFRVGFKDPTKQKQIKNIYIQLEASGIYSLGFHDLLHFINAEFSNLLDYDVTNDDLIPSRVDLNAFINGFDFSSLDADMFRHSFKLSCGIENECIDTSDDFQESFEFRSRRGIETLYLGSRSSSYYMKIYDKFKELNSKDADTSSMVKRYFLISQGLYSEHLWNLEFTIKKEVLNQYGVLTVSHLLLMADSIFRDMMKRNSFLGYDIDDIKKNRENKHISRLPVHPIWQKISDSYNFCNYDIDVQRVYKEYKKGSRTWASDNIIRTIRKQKELDNSYTLEEIIALYNEAQKDIE